MMLRIASAMPLTHICIHHGAQLTHLRSKFHIDLLPLSRAERAESSFPNLKFQPYLSQFKKSYARPANPSTSPTQTPIPRPNVPTRFRPAYCCVCVFRLFHHFRQPAHFLKLPSCLASAIRSARKSPSPTPPSASFPRFTSTRSKSPSTARSHSLTRKALRLDLQPHANNRREFEGGRRGASLKSPFADNRRKRRRYAEYRRFLRKQLW